MVNHDLDMYRVAIKIVQVHEQDFTFKAFYHMPSKRNHY